MKIKDAIKMAGMIERGNVMDPELAIFLLSELDGMIQSDIMLHGPEEIVSYDNQEQELLLKKPHDGIYVTYLTAMIRQCQGEFEGFNNAQESVDEKLKTFRRWYVQHYRPADTASRSYTGGTSADAFGFAYLTAYGLAVRHGYSGTEEEWLASLEGQPGAPGEAARMRFDAERGVIQWGVGEQWYDLFTIEELKDPVVEAMMQEVRALAEQAARDKNVANQAANTAAGYATAAGGHAKTAADAAADSLTFAGRAYASEQAAVTAAGDAQVQAETAQGYALRAEAAAKKAEEAAAGVGTGGNGSGSGQNTALTAAQVNLLEDAFAHIQWADAAGPQYAAQLIAALRSGESGGEEPEPEEPEQPEQPEQPVKTLVSISAVYDGGNVSVGTAVSGLTGVTVTAHYSDGSTANVTGYTLSGTIAEGENTVTVTYMGKTTTITVTGVAQAPDGRTLLHNWVLNDQSGSSIDTVGGAEAKSYYAEKTADGWVINDTWLAIKFLQLFGANRTVEFDMSTSYVAPQSNAGVSIVFDVGYGEWAQGTILQYHKTDGWRWIASGQTTPIPELQGENILNGKTVALCLSAEGALSLWLDGEYVSSAPGITTADSILIGNNANGFRDMKVSSARIYEGVL